MSLRSKSAFEISGRISDLLSKQISRDVLFVRLSADGALLIRAGHLSMARTAD